MKEQIYTIPVNEAFDSGDECPFCYLERAAERGAINYAVGPEASYMESDVRALTNELGFCNHHLKSLYDFGNSLGNALILQSYYKLLMDEFQEQLDSFDKPAKRGLFSRGKSGDEGSPPLVKWSRRRQETCYICDKVQKNMQRYYETFFMMVKKEEFRKKAESCKGFCMRHFADLVESAQDNLPNSERDWFYDKIFPLMKQNMDRVKGDLDDFVESFDYHQQHVITPNIRDALSRTMQKLGGLHPADPPFKGK